MTSKNKQHAKTDRLITIITGWIAGIIMVVLAIWGLLTLRTLYIYEETNDAQVEEYINPVTTRVTGYITKISYEENQDVKKGDTLLVIDNNEFKLQQQEAGAALSNAEAQVPVLESNVNTVSKSAEALQAQIASSKARLWKQEQEYARYQKLFDVESATQQQLENVKTALDVAKADYQSAIDNYAAAISRIQDIKAQKAVALTEIQRRQAMLGRNNLDVTYTVIIAPYNGKMGRRTIQEGQVVQAGQTLAFIVNQSAGKWVTANFKETQVSKMHIGQKAEIETDAFPGKIFTGSVESFSPATGSRFSLLPPDNASGNFVKIVQRIPVRIKLAGPVAETVLLRAGMNATVSIKK
ncbi:HlyD family efflux transporter periplasmic adaptor subunit [Chitinophaga oryziterrae]|uniref:HlyD family efflux transporter periplasmic adaptor subunit n=1 Tax=Chitinophaga oryziterrae TaxID=1031224 RepID=A0A6N8J8C7_9BACT|nr:HlyD family secretion protein [Chitinophaga oryziterrae]MVT40778.1 HlyD family efflux transporter periplasmic adaptor subunit [Chitinophaga oryziterrae]